MTIDLNIINGKVFTSDGLKVGGISIENELILKVGKEPSLPKASEVLDVKGALILPGIIDIHVHLRDLDQSKKETMETGTRSAVAGGVTTVVDMPNNIPPTNSVARIKTKKKIIEGKTAANIGFYTKLPGHEDEVFDLAKEGVFGYKIYPASTLYPSKDDLKLIEFMKKIAITKLPFIIHPDHGYAAEKERELFASNMPRVEAFTKAHNQIDEGKALKEIFSLNENIGCHIHCAHVTAKETVKVIESEKSQNLTGEVCPHHLMLTVNDLEKFKSEAKCLPPLRTNADQKALWDALKEDTIKIVTTDHAPHTYEEKHCEFEYAASGIHGLETFMPIMFTCALKGLIPLEDLIIKMTENPAKFLNLANRGTLEVGNFADVIIVRKEKNKINQEMFESKAKWTPLNGYNSLVKLKQVIVNGTIVKDEEHLEYKARTGKILESKLEIPKELLEED